MKPNNKKSVRRILWARYSKPIAKRLILIAIGLSAFFWLLDTVLDFFAFGFPGDFISQLFTPSPHEVWIRLIVVGILITFAIYAQFTITRRKQAEESLKQERDFSRSILQTANSMIFCLDADARITVFNDECERITGYSRDEVFGKRWPDLFLPPDKRHASLKSFVNWVRAHPRDSYEGPVVTKSGQIKTILWSNTSIIGSDPMDVTAIAIGCDVTERKRAEEALKEAYEIINRSPAVAFLWKNEERWPVEFVSENVRKLFGYTREEFTSGKVSYAKIVHPEDLKRVENEVSGYSNEKERTNFAHKPYRIVTKDGEIKWIDDITHIRRDPKGNITHYEGIVIDITGRKRIESKHKQNENMLRQIIDSTPNCIFVKDRNGMYLVVNKRMAELHSTTPEELVGKYDYEIAQKWFETVDYNEFRKAEQDVIDNKKTLFSIEEPFVYHDGTERWFQTTKIPFEMEDNQNCLLVISTDITERRRAAEKLKAAAEEWEVTFNAIPDLVSILDKDHRFVKVNKVYADVFGIGQQELIGKKCYEVVHGRKDPWPDCPFPQVMETRKSAVKEFYEPRLKIHLEVSVAPIFGEKGEITGIVHTAKDISERKGAEQRLRESEEKYRTLVETAQEGIGITDPDENLTFVNQAFADLLGYTKEELLALNLSQICDEEEFAKLRKESKKRQRGQLSRYETRLYAKTGEVKYFDVSATPLVEEKGTVTASLAFLNDITERKRAEQKLRELDQAIEQSPEGIGIADLDGRIVFVNPAWAKMHGYRVADLIGKPAAMLDTPENRKHFPKIWEEIKKKGFWQGEFQRVRKDGSSFTAVMTSSIVTDGKNKQVGIVGTCMDITERKKAEEKVRLLSHAVDSSVDGVAMGNLEGKITYVNETFVEMFGYSREELIGKEIAFIYPKDQMPKLKKAIKATMEDGWTGELVGKRKDGELFPMAISASRVVDGEGNVIAQMASHTDITERKQAEEALKESEEKFRTFMETASDLMHITDENGNITDANESMVRTLGYSKEEMIGMRITQLLTKEALEKDFKPNWEKFIANGRISIETTFATNDRKEIYGELKAVATYDSDGQYAGSRSVFHDLTERKRAEEKINMLSASIEDAYDGIALTEMNGDIIYANKAACKIFGYSHAEIMKLNIAAFSPDQEEAKKLDEGVKKEGRWSGEIRGVRKNKEKFPAILSVSVIKDEKGTPIVRIGVFKDITERKQAEEALRESEDKYRRLFELGSDALFLIEVETGRILDLNDTALKMYGYSREEVLQMKNTDFSAEPAQTRQATVEHEQQIPVRYHKKKDGTIFPTDISVAYFTWHGGEVCIAAIRDITGRKRAEKALRESEEKFRSLVENAPNIILIVDREGKIQFINQTVPGLAVEDVIGKNHLEYVDQEYHGITKDTIKQVFKTGEPSHYEIKGVGSEGSASWYATQVGPIKSEGQIDAVMLVTTDITERKRAEEEIRKFKTISDRAGYGSAISDLKGNLIYVNESFAQMHGYGQEELMGKNLSVLHNKEQMRDVNRLNRQLRQKGRYVAEEVWHAKKDGVVFPTLMTATVIKDDGGKPLFLSATAIDITERKRAEGKLKESEEKFRNLVERAHDAICIIQDDHFKFANQEFSDLLNYNWEELKQLDFKEVIAPDYRDMVADRYHRRHKGEEVPEKYELVLLTKDGERKSVELSVSLVDYLGEVASHCFLRDVTEKKKMEAQLIQAERRSAVGTLAYGIAHEFNNILAGILGNAEFGMGSGDSKEVEGCFRVIMENCDRAGSITNSLLTLARQRQAKKEVADLTDAVENVLGLVERELEKQNIRVERKFKPVPEIVCDLGELSEVFLNMITNARDAMKPDGGALTIEVRKRNHNIEIIFADTGGGIPDEIKGRIFEPFVTTKGALGQSEIPGTGLGLFLSIGIISRYQGEIEVESQVGKGSKFTIKIPLLKISNYPPMSRLKTRGRPFFHQI